MHSHPHLHPRDLIWLYFRLFRPNQLVSFISSPPWLSYAKPKWFYDCQSWQGHSGSAQWPLLFTSYSKVNTPARTQQDCWRNSFLLSCKCVCTSVCAVSVCARAEARVANSKPPFDRTVCVWQIFPLKVWPLVIKPEVHRLRLELVADPVDICAQVHLSLHAHSVETHSLPKVAVTALVMEPGVKFQWYKQSRLCASERLTYPLWQFSHTWTFFFLSIHPAKHYLLPCDSSREMECLFQELSHTGMRYTTETGDCFKALLWLSQC